MASKLSTHVLDNYFGSPAAGVKIALSRLEADGWQQLVSTQTNGDGRTDQPLLVDEALTTGRYQLAFHCATYYAERSVELSDPPFLDVIKLEVNLQTGQSYHVPLLMTPWSYSTYRGS